MVRRSERAWSTGLPNRLAPVQPVRRGTHPDLVRPTGSLLAVGAREVVEDKARSDFAMASGLRKRDSRMADNVAHATREY